MYKFKLPQNVRNAFKRGLRLQEKFGRGEKGIAKISMTLDDLQAMKRFFEENEQENRPSLREEDGGPTSGTITWLLHGGNAGKRWVDSIFDRELDKRIPDEVFERLSKEVEKHNETNTDPDQRADLETLIAVYNRGAELSIKRAIPRVNSFLRLLRTGYPGNPNYTQDNDLLPVSHNKSTRKTSTGLVNVLKIDDELGIVFGYAIICKQNGEEYFDLQGDHIPEESMLRASAEFMTGERVAKDMHRDESIGKVIFGLPVTQEIADSLDIEVNKTGLVIGMKPNDNELLEKYKSGEYTGFSIGGKRILDSKVD